MGTLSEACFRAAILCLDPAGKSGASGSLCLSYPNSGHCFGVYVFSGAFALAENLSETDISRTDRGRGSGAADLCPLVVPVFEGDAGGRSLRGSGVRAFFFRQKSACDTNVVVIFRAGSEFGNTRSRSGVLWSRTAVSGYFSGRAPLDHTGQKT